MFLLTIPKCNASHFKDAKNCYCVTLQMTVKAIKHISSFKKKSLMVRLIKICSNFMLLLHGI